MVIPEQIEARKRSIQERLNRGIPDDISQPMFSASNIHFELAERTHAISYGGIGLIHQLAGETGLVEAIDNNLHLLKVHVPYHESDHVLNIAYVVRKNISVEKGDCRLFDDVRYFFYITNDRSSSAAEVVFSCNDRCHQENLIEQLSNSVRAFRAPVDNLLSNWAYMIMTSLAWNLKAWCALWLPKSGRWSTKHRAEKQQVLKMEFRTFVNYFMKIPCQIIRTGRQLVYRLLNWNPWLGLFRRLAVELSC